MMAVESEIANSPVAEAGHLLEGACGKEVRILGSEAHRLQFQLMPFSAANASTLRTNGDMDDP
jgi:hypothetical protein